MISISQTLLLMTAALLLDSVRGAALPNEQVNSDGVSYLISTSSVACSSTKLEDNTGACVAEPTCTNAFSLLTIDPNLSEYPPSLRADRTAGANTLAIQVLQGSSPERVVTSIVLNASEPACNYPGPNWFHGVDTTGATCVDVYVSAIPWLVASGVCNMTRHANETFISYRGAGTIFYSDALPAIDGYALPPRELASVVQFEVEQPTTLDVISTAVDIFNDPSLLSAITKQKYDFATGNATLSVVLSLAAPLRTASLANMTNDANGVLISGAGVPSDESACPNSNSTTASCRQAYTFQLAPAQCSLNGTYEFTFQVECQPAVAGTPACPLPSGVTSLHIAVTLSSEDLCALAAQALRVSGTLRSYAAFSLPTFAFATPQTAFFQSAAEHFELNVTSDDGFPLASSAVSAIRLNNRAGDVVTLYAPANNVTPSAAWQFALDSAAAPGALVHRHHFAFVPAPTTFGGQVPRNAPVGSTVVADVVLTFQNGARKRALVELARRAVDEATPIAASFSGQVSVLAPDVSSTMAALSTTTAAAGGAAATTTAARAGGTADKAPVVTLAAFGAPTSTETTSKSSVVPAVVGTLVGVVLCAACVAALVLVARRRRREQDSQRQSFNI